MCPDQDSHDDCRHIVRVEHGQVVLVDEALVTHLHLRIGDLLLEVALKSGICEAVVPTNADESVSEKDKKIAEENVSADLFRLPGICYDWQTALMNKVACTKNSSKGTEPRVNEQQLLWRISCHLWILPHLSLIITGGWIKSVFIIGLIH